MTDIITLDYETYYDQEYSLRKLTTEEYIRDERFEVIGLSVQKNNGEPEWFTGTHEQVGNWLHDYCNWGQVAQLAHNNMFDAGISALRFGIHPKVLMCTLSMSRGHLGPYQQHSLAALAKRYKLPEKGTAVLDAKGKRRADFSTRAMNKYASYGKHDSWLCRQIFDIMIQENFPRDELKLVDLTLKMFTRPILELDADILEGHLIKVKRRKAKMMEAAAADATTLRSGAKFAELLEMVGVTPPKKISPKTGKETYAFAKTDAAMRELAEHPDPRVQILIAAKLGASSTLEESRTERFIGISKRGNMPVPLKYYAAHTGRWGGDDKTNFQNLPSRDAAKRGLKESIIAPEGHVIIDCDSSQIEARVLAWLAGQEDLLAGFRNKEDVYVDMAATIFGVEPSEVDGAQRGTGKAAILGCGYNMGGERYQSQQAEAGVEISLEEATRIVQVYRKRNSNITGLWKAAQFTVRQLTKGKSVDFGREGVLHVDANLPGLWLPNGMPMFFDRLHEADRDPEDDKGFGDTEFIYYQRAEPVRLYGGKLVENVCQALARIIVGGQMLRIARRYNVAMTVHDSSISVVPEDALDEARAYIEECMHWTPKWAEGLPITCESKVGRSYGTVKD